MGNGSKKKSSKKTVLDAIETSLKTISGVGDVIQYTEGYTQIEPSDFPALLITDEVAERERIAFSHSTNANVIDMQALLNLTIRGRIFSITNETATPSDNLLGLVEKTLSTSTAVDALVKDIYPLTDVTDEGIQDNFSSFSQTYAVLFEYNHANP